MLGLFVLSSSLRGHFVYFIVFFSLILKPTFILMCCPHDNNYYSKIVSCPDVMTLGLLLHCTVFIFIYYSFYFSFVIFASSWQGYRNSSLVINPIPRERRPITTPGSPCPTLFEQCVGSFTSRRVVNTEELPNAAYSFSSLSEKTRESNHL